MISKCFVGRDTELCEISEGLSAADSGQSVMKLVAGEPGIGKSALAHVAAQRAKEAGDAPAYWPWNSVIRQCKAVVGNASFTNIKSAAFKTLRSKKWVQS